MANIVLNYYKRNKKLKKHGFDSYQDFLKSKKWKNLKAFAWDHLKVYKCFFCKEKPYTLHHVKYTKITGNTLSWLIPVCKSCHSNIHRDVESKDTVFVITRKYADRMGFPKGCLTRKNLRRLWDIHWIVPKS